MLVPRFLFGDAREVRASIGRALTRLKKGATLEELSEDSGYENLAEHPDSLLWMQSGRVMRPATARDYRAVMFTDALFSLPRMPFERSNEIREQSADFLSRSPWGTVLLNSGGVWLDNLPFRPFRPCRKAYVAVLAGTLEHWDAITSLGARYLSGVLEGMTFPQTLPGYGALCDRLGLDPKAEGSGWKPIRELCADGSLLTRLRNDDAFWADYVRRAQSKWKTPELIPENIDEIAKLCEQGSGDKTQWNCLRQQRGDAAVEKAIATLTASGNVTSLMFAFVHGLQDLRRATALYNQHRSNASIQWAAERIAEHLAGSDPIQSAEIYFECAERAVPRGGKSAARQVVTAFGNAHKALASIGKHDVWHQRLARFKKAHARRRTTLAALREAYPQA